ncbi:hypothetical protein [Rhodopirellula halodulae]|uniref:hypothetical protein n=1 Tax=Rhodopirellula halodulae TaxID=2894198 RepID=UPI001E4EAD62|nr:hypothetical protein [Rhodopirellula sp. JC737]MCC9655778.1 hypothetical protein [Rhodopirellula sp. JC737]
MSSSLRILLTEGSSTSARQTLHCLCRSHTIDVMDSAALSQCRFSNHVRKWHRCPLSSAEPVAYLRRMMQLIHQHGYDVVVATHEQAYLLARVREQLSQHVGIAVPSFEAIDRLQNKGNFARVMQELNLPQPATRCINETTPHDFREACLQQTDFPCFVKTAHGTAGRGVVAIADEREWHEWITEQTTNEASLPGQEIIVQSAAPGELSILQAVFDRGELVAWHDATGLRRGVGGAPIVRISTHREAVAGDVEKLGQALNWHGALFLEYFFDETTGQHQFIEANPRIGETVNAMLSGVNLCQHLVEISLGNRNTSSEVQSGRSGVKTHQFLTALLDQAMTTHSRRAVWKECLDRICNRAGYRDSEPEMMRWRDDPLSLIPPVAVALEMLIAPAKSHQKVQSTVANYGLNADAIERIARLSDVELSGVFN